MFFFFCKMSLSREFDSCASPDPSWFCTRGATDKLVRRYFTFTFTCGGGTGRPVIWHRPLLEEVVPRWGTEMERVELSGTRGEHMSSRGAKTPMTLCEKTHNKSSRCPQRPLTLETNLGKVRLSDENKETRTFPTSLFGSRGYDFSSGIKTFGSD